MFVKCYYILIICTCNFVTHFNKKKIIELPWRKSESKKNTVDQTAMLILIEMLS